MAENAKIATKATRKPAAKRKPVTKRKPIAKSKRAAQKKSTPDFTARAQETGRNAFLAGLGFYGKVYDQAQEQFDSLQSQLETRRKKADKLYKELVKRGKKVEKAFDDIDLSKLEIESLTDRKRLEQRLKKVKVRFEDLKQSVRLKSAA